MYQAVINSLKKNGLNAYLLFFLDILVISAILAVNLILLEYCFHPTFLPVVKYVNIKEGYIEISNFDGSTNFRPYMGEEVGDIVR